MPAPFGAPIHPDGPRPVPTNVDRSDRRRSVDLLWAVLYSCLVAKNFVQFRSRHPDPAVHCVDRALGDFGDLANTQLTFQVQQVGVALLTSQLAQRSRQSVTCFIGLRGTGRRWNALGRTVSARLDHPVVRQREKSWSEACDRFEAYRVSGQGQPDFLQEVV